MEVFSALLGLFCVLAAVAVIGHGIWVLVAQIFGGQGPPLAKMRSCPRCGLHLADERCIACDWPTPREQARARPIAAVESLESQVKRLHQLGVLDPVAEQNMLRMLSAERERIALARRADAALAMPREEALAAEVVPEPSHPVHPKMAEPPRVPVAPSVSIEPLAPGPLHRPHAEPEFASGAPVARRAAQFEQARAAAGAAPRVVTPPPPRRSWIDLLAAFMEERNMRWGEMIGGMLIIGCSIALVISFWSDIAERPWLKFFLFNGVTAGLFAVGFHSERRWRLQMTSQGLLLIASLLVPLNFLAVAAFSDSASAGALPVIGEIVSALLFGTLIYFAGRSLVGDGALWLLVGILVPSLAQWLAERHIDSSVGLTTLLGIAALPVACYLVTNGWMVQRASRVFLLSEREVNTLFKFFALTSFAFVLPLALVLFKTEHPLVALVGLAPLVALSGLPALGVGLTLWQKLAGRALSALRTAGTSVAVAGAFVSLSGVVLAWPHPRTMLPTALVEFVIFTFIAWRFALPAAHLLAGACLAIAYLLGAYLLDHQIIWLERDPRALAQVLFSGRSGTLLVPLVVAYAAAAFLALRGNRASALALGGVAALVALVSTALVTLFGFGHEGDPVGAGWVYLVYAGGALAAAARGKRLAISWIAAALLLAGVVQIIVFHYGERLAVSQPAIPGLLVFCTLAGLAAAVVRFAHLESDDSPLRSVLWTATFVVSLAAAAWLVVAIPLSSAEFEAGHWFWLVAVWLAVAIAVTVPWVWTLFQSALVVGTVFAVFSGLRGQPWFESSPRPWLDPWTLSAIGLALAGLCLLWTLARMAARRVAASSADGWRGEVRAVLDSPFLIVDRVTAGTLVALVVAIAAYAAMPGVRQELSPAHAVAGSASASAGVAELPLPPSANFEWFGVPHGHAAAWPSWALLAAVAVLLVVLVREQGSAQWLMCLFLVTSAAVPLVASRWEDEVAVASALRWASALMLAAQSAPIWGRTWLGRQAERWGWRLRPVEWNVAATARALVFVLGLFPPVLVALGIATEALSRVNRSSVLWNESYLLAAFLGVSLLVAAAVWLLSLGRGAREPGSRPTWPSTAAALLVVLGSAPLVAMVLFHVGDALRQSPIRGPDPASIFRRMGLELSYFTPLVLIALVLVGHALRERSSGFALAGGLVLNLAATVAYLLAISSGAIILDAPQWIRLAQLNAVVAVGFSLAWLATLSVFDRAGARRALNADSLLHAQLALAPAIMALAMGWAWSSLVWHPTGNLPQGDVMRWELADAAGWASFAIVCASVWCSLVAAGRRVSMLGFNAFLVGVVIFAAAIVSRSLDNGNWASYHTLVIGHGLIATLLLGLVCREQLRAATLKQAPESPAAEASLPTIGAWSSFWIDLQGTIVLVLALRELLDSRWWWPAGGLAFLGVLLAPAAAWVFQRRRYSYLAAPLINAAGSIAAHQRSLITNLEDWAYWNVVLLAAPVVAWLLIELRRIRSAPLQRQSRAVPFHRVATRLALVALALTVAWGLLQDSLARPLVTGVPWVAWLALATTAVAAAACLWDVSARSAVAGLYVLGLIACGLALDAFDLPPTRLLWLGTVVLAAYALATSYLWSRRAGLLELAGRFGVPLSPSVEWRGVHWLVPCNLLLVALVVVSTLFVELREQQLPVRLLVSQAALVQAVSVALLARGDRRGVLQMISLLLGAFGAVMFAWAWLEVGSTLTVLHAPVMLAAALAAVAVLYGFGLGKFLSDSSDWLAPARGLTPWLAAGSGAALVAILGVEIEQFNRTGAVEIAWPALLAVALTLVGLAAAALAAAIVPGRDPLGLSERGRTMYVYGAEIVLALLFVHIRLTMPWLFSGRLRQYWPLVVMAIAFIGVGFAEFCRRRKQHVLATPIENTGALLPVLPVLGFWAAPAEVHYSLLLLTVGVLYAGLSIARRSFGFGVLAALAANGGLWYFLNGRDGLGFLAHPQVWLIPPALCVLAAAYINREQLSERQMTAIRYTTSMLIYVSSTADIFLNGVAQAPYLPIVLAVLSVAGIFAGMLLRARAFLFLGSGFLALALFSIIWHAAVDLEQTWIWWASGCVLGVLIVALFAIFEKKRQDILEMVETIKQWEG